MTDGIYLSVAIPAYNESHRIEGTLLACRDYLDGRGYPYEVIVVDDGSTDDTGGRVQALAADWPRLRLRSLRRNRGKGAAVREGCLAARGDFVLFMDADHSTRIDEVEAFLPLLEEQGYDIAVGVRTFQEGESRARRIVGLSFLILAHLIVFKKAVVDSQCGFKCFTRAAAQRIFRLSRIDGGTIDVEIFSLAHRLGMRIYFVPVHWSNPPGSTISPLRCFVQDPLDMLRIRWRVFDPGD